MERPRLFEYPIYAVILGLAGAWVYGLPPFTHDPSQPSAVAAQPAATTAALERRASSAPEQTEAAADERSAGRTAEPRSPAPEAGDTAGPEGADVAETERASLSEADAGEQPELDPQPNLLRVTANSLNMRAAPNAQSPRVGSYPKGAVVEPVTKQGNWVLVRTVDDATTGWMYVEYLDEVAEN